MFTSGGGAVSEGGIRGSFVQIGFSSGFSGQSNTSGKEKYKEG